MNRTLFKYIFFMQFKAMIFVAFLVFGLIYLFDFIEVMRKFPIASLADVFLVLKLSLLKAPLTFCEVAHYVYFITATFSLWSLCNSQQLTIMKSIGKSPSQILFPFISFAFFLAACWLFILHPFSILTDEKYKSHISASPILKQNENVWIDCAKNNKLIFIEKIKDSYLSNLVVFNLNDEHRLLVGSAWMEGGKWILKDVNAVNRGKVRKRKLIRVKNFLSQDLIHLLSAIPKKSDIYSLYKIYMVQNKSQIELREYVFNFHKLLANCFTFILFALIAALICFPINRYRSKTNIAVRVIFYSIFIKFANNICEMFAMNGILSVALASWGIILILSLLSVSVLVWKEL